ncbi:uncharacterized protein LOC111601880 [Drosophila hydei]|uniref:Uncharacterized protein LOC111601880 n=1 Tax=Drosophila hydei TaxID=7224 RepID=A0A6J2SSV5_DROHY|nr:uncharacterized protein LOC111601880 [Drosophila hydei]
MATRCRSTKSLHLCLCLAAFMLILSLQLSVCGAQSLPRMSRRPIPKTNVEESSERSVVPDQLAQAAGRADGHGRNYPRRGAPMQTRAKEPSTDFNYGQLELNLVRPEHETSSLPPQGKLNAYYGSGLSTTVQSVGAGAAELRHEKTDILEDSETAAEYVANAMKMAYGSRHKEQQTPLRIVANTQRPYSPSSSSSFSSSSEPSPAAPAPVYEKESVPRNYELYETANQAEPVAGGDIERLYRTKYYSYPAPQPQPQVYRHLEDEAEEKVRVSASTEIPKAEIMKQIEKSVIKYMKELEAEGKIITTPQELAPPATKTYYKLLSLPSSSGSSSSIGSEEKRYSSSTVRPKYSSPPSTGQGRQPAQQHGQYHGQHHQLGKQSSHGLTKPQRYQSETETAYQAPDIGTDSLAPNVEFIYKIKTRAPLQTATVKTVSKPYTLPLKSSAEHFDHGAALKNIEEFDLSHVVTTPERELEEQRVTSKPQKLYFNSEIYHDINSLPYKGEKLRGSSSSGNSASNIHAIQAQEYRHKHKAAADLHSDYKGYSGYFAEPASSSMELAEKNRELPSGIGNDGSEEGFPLPYQYVLKKEPLSAKYEEERESWEQSMRLAHGKPATNGGYKASSSSSSSLEYDSYSPKFNNNPEGYGYQHTYKTQLLRGTGSVSSGNSAVGKRGKRGGAPHPGAGGVPGKKLLRSNAGTSGLGGTVGVGGKLVKDLEANLALRPPPKI